jgi:hypothetical protein
MMTKVSYSDVSDNGFVVVDSSAHVCAAVESVTVVDSIYSSNLTKKTVQLKRMLKRPQDSSKTHKSLIAKTAILFVNGFYKIPTFQQHGI